MEFDIIPQIIIIVSIGVVIYILGRNIPKAKDASDDLFKDENESKNREKFLYLYERLTRRINREKYQEKVDLFWIWFEKVLRRLRINFLKIDGKIESALDKVREKNIENEIEDEAEKKDQQAERGKIRTEETNIESKETKVETGGDNNNPESIEKTKAEMKNKSEKEKEYLKLIVKNPIDIKSYWNLGIIYSRKKNYRDAISCFRQIVKIDPTYTRAKKKIIDLMERMKRKNSGDRK